MNLETDDIGDAVELSIAASEALAIHEIVRSESVAFETEAVLEAALQVKQARLESLVDVSSCSMEEVDEIDFISDLDDLTMMDAFEDVGLCFSSFSSQYVCGKNVSPIRDARENDHSDVPASKLKRKTLSCDSDHGFYQSRSAMDVSDVSDTVQRVCNPISETSAQYQDGMDVFDARNLPKDVEEDKATYLAAEGSRSRWLGGWTRKGIVNAPAKPLWKSIPKCFVETSFLSESADVADANSFVQNRESRLQITSQQSVHFKGFHDQAGGDISVSQDVRSINLSLGDPLCSIVPCSISSDNDGSPPLENQSCVEPNPQIRLNLTDEFGAENFPRTSEIESIYEKGKVFAPLVCEDSAATVRIQSNSLKPYSTLPFKQGSNLCSVVYSDKRDSKGSLPVTATVECIISRDTEEVQKDAIMEYSDFQTTNMKKISDEYAKDKALFQVQPSKRRAPLVINQKFRQCLQSSRLLVPGSLIKKSPVQASRKNPSSKLCNSSMLETRQFEGNGNQDAQARFSEAKGSYKRSYKSATQIQENYSSLQVTVKDRRHVIFPDIEFLLTGFSKIKEKELEGLIQKYGGIVLGGIPSPTNSRGKRNSRSKFQPLPVVLCTKKLQTTKFLYGCAINAPILKVKWLTDSIAAGLALPSRKYLVLSSQPDPKFLRTGKPVHNDDQTCIFDRVGIMLHGSHGFYTKFSAVIQHGGGRVFKTLNWLVHNLDSEKISLGVIVAENENTASRHLRYCALERKIPVVPTSWIVKSLHLGKLHSLITNNNSPTRTTTTFDVPVSTDWSQEI